VDEVIIFRLAISRGGAMAQKKRKEKNKLLCEPERHCVFAVKKFIK